ncbi:hypothetical protein F4Y93_12720 [Candidatus Poribacteria bacterium]|nr:hypothetical protein [Candidatus Poribacteria bacterium]
MAKDKPAITAEAADWLAGYAVDADNLSGPQIELANAIHAAAAADPGPTAPENEHPGGATVTAGQWAVAEQDFAEWSAGLRTDAEVAQRNAEVLQGGDDDQLLDRLSLSATDLAALRKLAAA